VTVTSSSAAAFAAVDLGASSGRVVLGRVSPDSLAIEEVHRFANVPVRTDGTLHWDILGLFRETLAGLHAAAARADLGSIGIDSWAVDYGLLDSTGALIGNPVHYRDARTDGVVDEVLLSVSPEELYATTGIQLMPINTLFQLCAARGTPALAQAGTLLLVPDLFGYWLTGNVGAELTSCSISARDAGPLTWRRDSASTRRSWRRCGARASWSAVFCPRSRGTRGCRLTFPSSRWARTTPPRPWWACPRSRNGSSTSRAEPGHWWASNSPSRS
jgi:rhamnulokinase